ncbi:MAG: NAD-dependent epimerase/dehydratase family protein [Longimicrobiales bacterium]
MKRIVVTGAAGQVGTELVPALRTWHGEAAVLATDVRDRGNTGGGPFRRVDCMDAAQVAAAVREHRADTIFHLAALLSASAEKQPQNAYTVNTWTLYNVLEVAREAGCSVFVPSSIAVFGPGAPRDPAPQDALQRPTTIYGVTKVAGELLCDYYHARFGVEVRGLRYPGLISWVAPPGGGTTDWAVDIFHQAVARREYECFLSSDTQLDMMFMADAIRAAHELMQADGTRLVHRNAFNVTAMQLTPAGLANAIRTHLPDFDIRYAVDPVRQAIADSWPRRLDDSAARREWGWKPEYDSARMTADMLHHLSQRAPGSGASAAGAA